MTPDRLRAFLKKRPVGTVKLKLHVDTKVAASLVELAVWPVEDLDAMDDAKAEEITGVVLATCQEYTDSEEEKQKFLIRWFGNKTAPLKVVTHHCTPKPREDPAATELSNGEIIVKLLDHLDNREKHVETITTGYDKTILMLTGQLEFAYRVLGQRAEEASSLALVNGNPVELTAEQTAEIMQRTAAWTAFAGTMKDKMPDAIDAALAWFAKRYLKPDDVVESNSKGAHAA